MANKNKRKRKAYTLKEVQLISSNALQELERIILSEKSEDTDLIRAVNSLATMVNSYTRLAEVVDIEKRIQEIEEKINEN